MEKNKPKVSVIMAFYNVEDYIEEAIKSVLNQNFRDFELIIINDCSPDKSFEIAQKYAKLDPRIVLINNEKNLGCAEARNVGLNIARGDYISIFDSDDVCMPERFLTQVDYLEKNLDVFLVASSFYYVNENGEVLDVYKKSIHDQSVMKKELLRVNIIHNPTVMFRNSTYRYRDKFVPAEDYDLWLRMLTDNKKIVLLDDLLIKYRIQKNSQTNTRRKKQRWGVKKALQFYYQRLKTGNDKYDELVISHSLLGGKKNNSIGVVSSREIKLYFKNNSDFGGFRKMVIEFWREYSVMIWPASIIYFVISFFPKNLIKKIKKIIWN